MKFAQVPITTSSEYQAMLDRGVDFCDGCGHPSPVADLEEANLEASGGFLIPGLACGPCRHIIFQEQEETSPSCLAAQDSF